MKEVILGGVVTFRYTKDNIELLLVDYGNGPTHPRAKLQNHINLEKEILRSFDNETGLSLIVASLEPIYQYEHNEKKGRKETKSTVYYYAGITDSDQEVLLSNETYEYIWIDHLGGRNSLISSDDIKAYEIARNWLYDHDEAALFLANNMRKLL